MKLSNVKEISDKIQDNIERVIVGKREVIKLIIAATISRGHVLIEDKPGTGKTTLAKAFARSIDGLYKRIQFTPDLMPSDVTGLNIYNQKLAEFEMVKGPVFTNILLGDEINRATPRTQSALLEAMEERQVTIDGKSYELGEPFIVIATQNPIEVSGTYPLPEAQLDRFIMKLDMGDVTKEEELDIIQRFIDDNPLEEIGSVCSISDIEKMSKAIKKVYVDESVRKYIVDIMFEMNRETRIANGMSVRATLALTRCAQAYSAISGKDYVDPDTVRYLAPFVLGHRIFASTGIYNESGRKKLVSEVVSRVCVPVEDWEKKRNM